VRAIRNLRRGREVAAAAVLEAGVDRRRCWCLCCCYHGFLEVCCGQILGELIL
jgi:hypothetical protein